MKTFTFELTLSGVGETEEEAWANAVEQFSMEPGIPTSSTEEKDDGGATANRHEMEILVVTRLLRQMKAHGWEAIRVFDGEEFEATSTEEEVLNVVFAVDESDIIFERSNTRKTVCIVLGNDGYDCIADHSTGGEFEQVMDEMQKFCDTLAKGI